MALNVKKRLFRFSTLLTTDNKLKDMVFDILNYDEVFEHLGKSGKVIVFDTKLDNDKILKAKKTFVINADLDEGNSFSITETILYTINGHSKQIIKKAILINKAKETTFYNKQKNGLEIYDVKKDGSLSKRSILPSEKKEQGDKYSKFISSFFCRSEK